MPENLQTEIVIHAPREKVWEAVSDLRRMPQWSPQCRKVLARRPITSGTSMVNINRDGFKVWPTRTRVVDYAPNERIAFKVLDNLSVWSFTLSDVDGGTRVVQRRDVPATGTSKISQRLVDTVLGGDAKFTASLRDGMNQTLDRLKAAIEA